MLDLAGKFTPLVTPFTDDGATISEVRLSRLLTFHEQTQLDGFALATDVGEFTSLTFAERKTLLEWAQRITQGRFPIIVNASSMSTSGSLDLAQHAARHGARAVTLMPPYYGSFTQSELVTHIRVVASHSTRPLIVVDPEGKLQQDTFGELTKLANVHVAWPTSDYDRSATDWFRCYSAIVEPMLAVPGSKAADFVMRNRAAVAKTLLIDQEIEVGPPRMPVLPIPYREIRKAA